MLLRSGPMFGNRCDTTIVSVLRQADRITSILHVILFNIYRKCSSDMTLIDALQGSWDGKIRRNSLIRWDAGKRRLLEGCLDI